MSELSMSLKPLSECVEQIRRDCDHNIATSIRWHRENRDENIARLESNRRVLALLDAAGFTIASHWNHGASFRIDLGFFPSTKTGSRALAEKLRQIRLLIEDKLGTPSKDVADEKKGHVLFEIRPPAYPGMRITYSRRLPKGARCRIVSMRSVSRRLVCEV